jgi:type I restriction enzyme M protein
MLRPRAKEFVIDPACGTGSFLLGCLDYVHQNSADKADEFAANRLYGMERMRDIVSIAKTNMILHGGDYSKVFCADSLLQLPDEVHAVVKQGGFDVVLVDPPLGSQQIEAREYRLGEHAQASVLFIERALQLAKPRGRIGVIVPENVLFAENLRHVRSFVMEKAFVRAIVSLPNGAYLPFTALRANALILEKKEHDQDVEYDVFMAEADAIDSLSVISQRFTEEW